MFAGSDSIRIRIPIGNSGYRYGSGTIDDGHGRSDLVAVLVVALDKGIGVAGHVGNKNAGSVDCLRKSGLTVSG